MVPLNEVAGQPGLEFLQGISAGRNPLPPMAAVIPVAPVEVEVGQIVFRAVPEARLYNTMGSVHGGYAATLLDTAMACAVHSTLKAGKGYTSLEIKIAFHKPITRQTGELRIEGRILSRGARVGSAEGRLTDTKGDLLASGTVTCLTAIVHARTVASSTCTPFVFAAGASEETVMSGSYASVRSGAGGPLSFLPLSCSPELEGAGGGLALSELVRSMRAAYAAAKRAWRGGVTMGGS
jgi:uncharacterized protein (TIGR00369 family)